MRLLTHKEGAELLFAAGIIPANTQDVLDRIIEQLLQHGGDRTHFADELAQEYARHPDSAAAHMTACLAAFDGDVTVPDWPERGEDGHLYTGMADE